MPAAPTGLAGTRRPYLKREFIFGAGRSTGVNDPRYALIYANKTSAGSETVNTIGDPIADDTDCINRFGRRSEARLLYRKFRASNQVTRVYIIAPTESAGTAGTVDVTFTTTAAATGTAVIWFLGEKIEWTINEGDTVTTIAAAGVAAFNKYDEGSLPATANNSSGVITITCAQIGPRCGEVCNSVRVHAQVKGTGVATTVAVGNYVAGTTEDDFTTAFGVAALGEYFYQVNPKFETSAPTATDNGVGEGIAMIKQQALAVNSKSQIMFLGLTGTAAQGTTVCTDSDANSVYAHFFWAKNSEWTAGMIAAHMTGAAASEFNRHPCANMRDYTNTDTTVLQIPAPWSVADRPTATEIDTALADGFTPIAFTQNGSPYVVRHICSRTVNAQSSKDYRASEGHIGSGLMFTWALLHQRASEQRTEFVDNDPAQGQKPTPNTTTPSSTKALVTSVIDDLSAGNPLGTYNGPILAPSMRQTSVDSIDCSKIAGGILCQTDFYTVEHLLFQGFRMQETSPAY